jgi:hypothetical protein
MLYYSQLKTWTVTETRNLSTAFKTWPWLGVLKIDLKEKVTDDDVLKRNQGNEKYAWDCMAQKMHVWDMIFNGRNCYALSTQKCL